MKVDPLAPTYPNWRVVERLIGPGKGFRGVCMSEFEKARLRAEIRLEGIQRQKMARSDHYHRPNEQK